MNVKREKTKIKSKIRLIYYLKLKSDIIGRKIRRKTKILIWDSAQIDPTDGWIKSFSFHEFEDDRRHSRRNFSLFSQQNLNFKYSSNAQMSLEVKGSKKFKGWDL